ncbi:MAG: 4Fe-4S binding protein [Firmicutes bacterium]|nr:4Fe-4S binding protein [Bacillota bacterium]
MSLKSWNEVPLGGVILEAGNAKEYKTGDWRSQRPVVDKEKCINCLTCFIFCPDSAIKVENGIMIGYDYDFCKGCGICANECPKKCITMKPEADFR